MKKSTRCCLVLANVLMTLAAAAPLIAVQFWGEDAGITVFAAEVAILFAFFILLPLFPFFDDLFGQ